MLFFELLDQYEGICRRAFFGCATKLRKTFKTNIIEILILIMCIPRKINFLQAGRQPTKVLRKQTKMPFSIGQIKSLMVNAHFIKRFFDLSGIDPDKILNLNLSKNYLDW